MDNPLAIIMNKQTGLHDTFCCNIFCWLWYCFLVLESLTKQYFQFSFNNHYPNITRSNSYPYPYPDTEKTCLLIDMMYMHQLKNETFSIYDLAVLPIHFFLQMLINLWNKNQLREIEWNNNFIRKNLEINKTQPKKSGRYTVVFFCFHLSWI